MTKDSSIPCAQILIADDEAEHAEVMAESLRRLGHVCTLVHNSHDAIDELSHGQFDVIVTDLVMEQPDDGLRILAAARQHQSNAETILVTAHGDVPTCKTAIKQGAYDFIEKPLDLDVFRTLVGHAIQAVALRATNTHLQQRVDETFGFEGIIGSSPQIKTAINLLKQIAPNNIPVLITGESGTGKELIAQAIHNNSKRAKQRFVPLNCAGLSESILEDELFGHVKGAFTGADREREGRFEYASGGTLFLDEVGDMPLIMQAKLLRVLESGEVVRLGANKTVRVDVRFISATNRNLQDMVKTGDFREDLYYRIKGANIHLPSLRERREDIPLLVTHFVKKFATDIGRPNVSVAEETQHLLAQYAWPGNIRQLINVVQSMVVMCEGDRLLPQHVPDDIKSTLAATAGNSGDHTANHTSAAQSNMNLDQIEKQAIRNALQVHAGNREAAAKMLGIGERTLYRKLKEYGLR